MNTTFTTLFNHSYLFMQQRAATLTWHLAGCQLAVVGSPDQRALTAFQATPVGYRLPNNCNASSSDRYRYRYFAALR